jgi:hypothetical protein
MYIYAYVYIHIHVYIYIHVYRTRYVRYRGLKQVRYESYLSIFVLDLCILTCVKSTTYV